MTPFLYEPHDGSRTLVAAFTSYGLDHVPLTSFEWTAVLRRLPVHRLLLLDPRQIWYRAGIAGLGEGMAGIADAIVARARACGADRVVTLGSSMGGYGALTIGGMAGADLAITFGAIATASLAFSERNDDWRCRHKLREIQELGLEHVISAADPICPFINYYDPDDRLERLHAGMLAPFRQGAQVKLRGSGHRASEWLARRRLLTPLVDDILFPVPGRRMAMLNGLHRLPGDPPPD